MRVYLTLIIIVSCSFSLFSQEMEELIDSYGQMMSSYDYPGASDVALQIADQQWSAQRYDEALYYAKKATEAADKTSGNLLKAHAYYWLGRYQVLKAEEGTNNLNAKSKDLNRQAVKNLKTAEKYYLKTNEKQSEDHVWATIYGGKAHIALGEFKQSIKPLEFALNKAEKNKYVDAIIESSQLLAIVSSYLNNDAKEEFYRSKYETYLEYRQGKDEIEQRDMELKDKDRLISQKEVQLQQRQDKLKMVELQQKAAEEELERKRLEGRFLYVVGVMLLLIVIISLVSINKVRKANKVEKIKNQEITRQKNQIVKQKKAIEGEKAKVETLLRRMLPISVISEFKDTGTIKPVSYREVSILFADFKGFTSYATRKSPGEIVHELDICFTAFDKILERHTMEKIKTIGDGYMAAGGIPKANKTNALDAVNAALDMMAYIVERKRNKEAMGEEYFGLRIGIHTGRVVAGIVGEKKFAYDIWGDAVNVAARMETMGEVGKINISEETYSRVKDDYFYTYRGKLDVKNKGQMAMYFVDGTVKYAQT